MASTGEPGAARGRLSRRGLLRVAALAPLAALLAPRRLGATEYGSAAEVFDAVDRFEADVAARLRGIASTLASARPFAESALADHGRHRRQRDRLRRRLRLATASTPASALSSDRTLDGLRGAQEALVYAHAEGLPALDDPLSVDAMARHMVDLSRHLTLIDLWIEAEASRG